MLRIRKCSGAIGALRLGGMTLAGAIVASSAQALPIDLTPISTPFPSPIGIDFHEPTDSVVMSVNYSTGLPENFRRVESDGDQFPFSAASGFTNEVKIATVRSPATGGLGGVGLSPFTTGDLFTGNGLDGEIVRITDGGGTVMNPWVSLPGAGNGLMRGSLYVDRTGVWDGDLIAVTTLGEVWRIDSSGAATFIDDVDVHLEGVITVPDDPAKYGGLAGKIIAGNEANGRLYAFDGVGPPEFFTLFDEEGVRVDIEDIDLIPENENFFGVNFGTGQLLGARASDFAPLVGDILLTDEFFPAGTSGLFRFFWDFASGAPGVERIDSIGFTPGQWEHVTFAPIGIREIPPPGVPEPAALLLVAVGLLVMAFFGRRWSGV